MDAPPGAGEKRKLPDSWDSPGMGRQADGCKKRRVLSSAGGKRDLVTLERILGAASYSPVAPVGRSLASLLLRTAPDGPAGQPQPQPSWVVEEQQLARIFGGFPHLPCSPSQDVAVIKDLIREFSAFVQYLVSHARVTSPVSLKAHFFAPLKIISWYYFGDQPIHIPTVQEATGSTASLWPGLLPADLHALASAVASVSAVADDEWFPKYGCAILLRPQRQLSVPQSSTGAGSSRATAIDVRARLSNLSITLLGLDQWSFTTHRCEMECVEVLRCEMDSRVSGADLASLESSGSNSQSHEHFIVIHCNQPVTACILLLQLVQPRVTNGAFNDLLRPQAAVMWRGAGSGLPLDQEYVSRP